MVTREQLNQAELRFEIELDEATEWEIQQKGWFEGASLVLRGGLRIPLSFWDMVRLAQEVKADEEAGRIGFSEPALIILPKVSVGYMQRAVRQLLASGYFYRLLQLTSNDGD